MLGTPPAFILSQDQTLIKSFFRPAIFKWYFWLTVFRLHFSMPVLLNVFWLSAEDPAPYLGQELFFRIFQGYSIVQLSRFCCCSQQLLYSIIFSFVCQQLFLIYFVASSHFLTFRNQLEYLTMSFHVCQYLFLNIFQTFLITYQERRRRDLNPRAAINDLHPFQGCPFGQLGYFSRWQNSFHY